MRRDVGVARRAIKRQGFRILLPVFVAAVTETVAAVFVVQSDSKVVQQVCKDIDPRAVLRRGGLRRSRMHDNSPDVSGMTDTQIEVANCEELRAASNHARDVTKRNCVSRTREREDKESSYS